MNKCNLEIKWAFLSMLDKCFEKSNKSWSTSLGKHPRVRKNASLSLSCLEDRKIAEKIFLHSIAKQTGVLHVTLLNLVEFQVGNHRSLTLLKTHMRKKCTCWWRIMIKCRDYSYLVHSDTFVAVPVDGYCMFLTFYDSSKTSNGTSDFLSLLSLPSKYVFEDQWKRCNLGHFVRKNSNVWKL